MRLSLQNAANPHNETADKMPTVVRCWLRGRKAVRRGLRDLGREDAQLFRHLDPHI